jgi:hypothetical protein
MPAIDPGAEGAVALVIGALGGITCDVTGCSGTELAIDVRVFRAPDQRRRSLFFLIDALN